MENDIYYELKHEQNSNYSYSINQIFQTCSTLPVVSEFVHSSVYSWQPS